MYQLLQGDCTQVDPGGLFHAVLCDPPYELNFMGKDWDRSGIAFKPATWAAIAEHLHPGGFLMAFASSRGWHRLACAIEDAGLIIHPAILGWSFASGFPKATRIDTQIDRAAGAERKPSGINPHYCEGRKEFGVLQSIGDSGNNDRPCFHANGAKDKAKYTTTAILPLARAWAGHRYGLQALKPAVEIIIVAQKPYQGKPVECITRTGAGAIWIDGGRITTDWENDPTKRGWQGGNTSLEYDGGNVPIHPASVPGHQRVSHPNNLGRWPSNLILCHLPECNGSCVEGCPILALDRQSGEVRSSMGGGTHRNEQLNGIQFTNPPIGYRSAQYHDSGTASRFYHQVETAIDEADPIRYCAKASRRERDAGLEGMPEKLIPFLEGDTRPGHADGSPSMPDNNRSVCYARNVHPTVKPLALTRYLSTLLLPPAAYAPRRLLVPFAGVGSEMIGALQAGWEEVVGIELDPEYCEIAEKRIEWAMKQPAQMPMEISA